MADDSQTVEWRRERADALSTTQRKRADARTCTAPLEFREDAEGGGWTVRSYASLFNNPYTIGTGAYRFTETVKPGAFKRSLGTNPDVVFRTEHSNAPLAATWNDTLRLGEDNVGFWYEADLNPEDPDAQTLRAKVKRGDYRESSFAFRIMGENGDKWNDDRSERELVACDINRGDVSVVTFGASPGTGRHMLLRSAVDGLEQESILQLRSEFQENEERIGRMISTGSMDVLRNVLDLISDADDAVDAAQPLLADLMGVPNPDADEDEDADGRSGDPAFVPINNDLLEAARAAMSGADTNDLPDSDFAYIEPGGTKDSEGKTTPRSKRHFPINDADHVRNALARLSQSPFGSKARPKVLAAAKKFGIDVSSGRSVVHLAPNDTDEIRLDWEARKMGFGR